MENSDLLPEIEVTAGTQELYYLQSSIRHLLDEVILARIREYEHQLKDQDTELLMLRSQLRPHFYHRCHDLPGKGRGYPQISSGVVRPYPLYAPDR